MLCENYIQPCTFIVLPKTKNAQHHEENDMPLDMPTSLKPKNSICHTYHTIPTSSLHINLAHVSGSLKSCNTILYNPHGNFEVIIDAIQECSRQTWELYAHRKYRISILLIPFVPQKSFQFQIRIFLIFFSYYLQQCRELQVAVSSSNAYTESQCTIKNHWKCPPKQILPMPLFLSTGSLSHNHMQQC